MCLDVTTRGEQSTNYSHTSLRRRAHVERAGCVPGRVGVGRGLFMLQGLGPYCYCLFLWVWMWMWVCGGVGPVRGV